VVAVAVTALAVPTLSGSEPWPICPDCLPADTTGPETTMVLEDGSGDFGISEVVYLILKIYF